MVWDAHMAMGRQAGDPPLRNGVFQCPFAIASISWIENTYVCIGINRPNRPIWQISMREEASHCAERGLRRPRRKRGLICLRWIGGRDGNERWNGIGIMDSFRILYKTYILDRIGWRLFLRDGYCYHIIIGTHILRFEKYLSSAGDQVRYR